MGGTFRRSVGLTAALLALPLTAATPAVAAAAHNDFAAALAPETLPFHDSAFSGDATTEPGEPVDGCAPVGRTVWYRYTATDDRRLLASVTGSSTPVVLAVFTGPSLDDLTQVACLPSQPAGTQWKLPLDATVSTTYHFQLGAPPSEPDGTLRFTLEFSPSLAGNVWRPDGRGIVGACVTAYDSDHRLGGTATTGPHGRYSIDALPGGRYHVFFEDCATGNYPSEWHRNRPDFDSADPVELTSGSVSTANAVLGVAGSISGTVMDADTGFPVTANACVAAYTDENGLPGHAQVRPDGTYVMEDLFPGTYKVRFLGCPEGQFFSEWYHDKTSFAAADPVQVIEGQETSGINASIVPASGGGVITGTVTDAATGTPIYLACAYVYLPSGQFLTHAFTTRDGTYRIEGLASATYRLFFGCGSGDYQSEWYDDVQTLEEAAPVPVTDPGETNGIDAALQPGPPREAAIRGVVYTPTHVRFPGVCVVAMRLTDGPGLIQEGFAVTGPNGAFKIDPLPPASYKIYIFHCHSGAYQAEWYDDAIYEQEAAVLTLSQGELRTLDDIELSYSVPDVYAYSITVRNDRSLPYPIDEDVGMARVVTVGAANSGPAPAFGARLTLTACPATHGPCKLIGLREDMIVEPGNSFTMEFFWDGQGFFGDVELIAEFSVPGDPQPYNDRVRADHYVLVGGTGVGVAG